MQALSLTAPGVERLDVGEAKTFARSTNAALADAVRLHPTRFFGLAALPIADPPAAVAELERAVGEQGFKGVVINGHHLGRYLDDRSFWPVLARAEALKLPIYLHPTQPPQPVIDAWFGGLDPMVGGMAGPGWGWHIETALHVLRMIVDGVFDAHPELQIRCRAHGRDAAVHACRRHSVGPVRPPFPPQKQASLLTFMLVYVRLLTFIDAYLLRFTSAARARAACARVAGGAIALARALYGAGDGGVAERLKAHAWKVCMRETVSRVRIPPPPPTRAGYDSYFSWLGGHPDLYPQIGPQIRS